MKLSIYPTPSGQWAGRLVDEDGREVMRIAGCNSKDEVEDEVRDGGFGDFTVTVLDQAP